MKDIEHINFELNLLKYNIESEINTVNLAIRNSHTTEEKALIKIIKENMKEYINHCTEILKLINENKA